MTTATEDYIADHPRTRSMAGWRAKLGAMASRGETDGPRVDEAPAALTWWRHRTYLVRELHLSGDRADSLLDLIEDRAEEARTEPAAVSA